MSSAPQKVQVFALGRPRQGAGKSLALLTPLLVRDGAPKPPAGLADWLRQVRLSAGRESRRRSHRLA